MATSQETKKTTAKPQTKATTKSSTTVKAAEKKVTATKKAEVKEPMVKITLVRSTNGVLEKQKRTIQAMGLRKIRSSVVMKDNACTRGMIYVVKHLVTVEEVK